MVHALINCCIRWVPVRRNKRAAAVKTTGSRATLGRPDIKRHWRRLEESKENRQTRGPFRRVSISKYWIFRFLIFCSRLVERCAHRRLLVVICQDSGQVFLLVTVSVCRLDFYSDQQHQRNDVGNTIHIKAQDLAFLNFVWSALPRLHSEIIYLSLF
jgi:hypothetical protein